MIEKNFLNFPIFDILNRFILVPHHPYLLLPIYSAGKKKRTAQKGYFGARNKYLFIIFFFSCLKMVICELMLLELGDLLRSSLLRNFFTATRSTFSCKYFNCFIQYIWRLRNPIKIIMILPNSV